MARWDDNSAMHTIGLSCNKEEVHAVSFPSQCSRLTDDHAMCEATVHSIGAYCPITVEHV